MELEAAAAGSTRRTSRICIALAGVAACAPLEPFRDPPICDAAARTDPLAVTHFHGDSRKLGHNDAEPTLTPDIVRAGLTLAWRSRPLHRERIDGTDHGPLIYASPLYVDGRVITATSNGWAYAVHAVDAEPCSAGDIAWSTKVAQAEPLSRLDGFVPMGVLSTPVIDRAAGRVYLAAHDAWRGWLVAALDLETGMPLSGWPVVLDDASLGAVNTNGPARFHESERMSQRGALQLSPDGERAYLAFGTYVGDGVGWIVAVDTTAARVAAAFSAAPSSDDVSTGGMWGSAGPAVDDAGKVWVTSGNSPGSGDKPSFWGSSLLQLSPELVLERVYTPFNYCVLDERNMDLGSSQPLLLPPHPASATPNLVAFGGKQGVVYLVDRDAMSPAGTGRAPCSSDASSDASLLPPEPQPQFGSRGPLSVFGPYSDVFGEIDHAKMRSKLAYLRTSGVTHLYASGTSKASEESVVNVAPALIRLRVHDAGGPGHLSIDATNPSVVMHNPGSPYISSDDGRDAVVWIVDRNAPRTAALTDPSTPRPVLHAFAADTLEHLWRSDEGALGAAGKYQSPIVVHGQVIVATDAIEAFAPR